MAERIAVVGLGRMGAPLAARLAGAGVAVTGWTRSGVDRDWAASVGVAPAATLAEAAAGADIIILSLFDDAAVTAVLDQLLGMDIAGRLIVDTSTVSPALLSNRLLDLRAAGATACDAPIVGGPEMVTAGTAGYFLGGAPADVARLTPVLALLSERVIPVGALGTGMAMKVVNNGLLQGYWATLSEMIQIAKRSGIPLETAVRIIAGGPAAMPMFVARVPKILGEDDTVGFAIAGARKDARVFLDAARDLGVATPTVAAAHDRLAAPDVDATVDHDVAALIRLAYEQA